MPDFNNPLSTQGYLALLASIVENNKAALQWLDNVASLTNLPAGAKRWNETNKNFEEWSGSAWAALASLYEIKVRNADQLNGQTEAYYRNAGNLNAGILPAARFNDTAHGNRAGGSLHAAVTTSVAGFMSASDKSKLNGIETGATGDQSGSEILALLLPVDGAGSGLDADLLDGSQKSTILARASHTGTQPMSTISDAGALATLNDTQWAAAGVNKFPCGAYQGNGFSSFSAALTYSVVIRFVVPSGFNGALTHRIGLIRYSGEGVPYGRIYKNSVAVGVERNNASYGWVYWDENISVSAGDIIELKVYNTSISTYGANDCRLQVLGSAVSLLIDPNQSLAANITTF